jgi:hypothetical protein
MGGFGMDLSISGIAATIVSVAIVLGLLFSVFWFFKKSESISEEDRLNIERTKVAFMGATALAIVLLFVHFKEQAWHKMAWRQKGGLLSGAASLARGLSGRNTTL